IIWTPLGVQHARNFEDLSPAIRDEDGEVILVHSVALTPNGKVEGLEFFKAVLGTQEAVTAESKSSEEKTIKLLSVVRLLGLPETVDEKMVWEKLEERLKRSDENQHVSNDIITGLNAQIKTLEDNIKKMAEDGQAAEHRQMLALLSAEGKS